MPTEVWPTPARRLDPYPAQALANWLRWTITMIVWSALVGGAALLVGRRIAGVFNTTLSTPALIAVGLMLAGFALLARESLPRAPASAQRTWRKIWPACAPLFIAVAGAMAVSLPKSSPLGIGALWGLMGVAAAAAFRPAGRPVLELRAIKFGGLAARARAGRVPGRSATGVRGVELPELRPAIAGESQALVRWDAIHGDTVRGRVRARVPAGRSAASAHVAFCPPFSARPEVTIRSASNVAGIEVSVGQVVPHGVRFDVKLSASASKTLAVQIEFCASAPTDDIG